MISAPCQPPQYDEEFGCFYVCAAALSQELTKQLSSTDLANCPWKVGPGGGTRMCGECADNLSVIVGNIEAVRQEWGVA